MTAPTRTVWFHRQYERLTGGQVKHAHYYEHVSRLSGHSRRIVFSGAAGHGRLSGERAELWPTTRCERAEAWQPERGDVLFLAGTDWRYYDQAGLADRDIPRINLIQGVRHGDVGSERYGYLDRRAVRICVSDEVAQTIGATGRVKGPVFTIRNGTECRPAEIDVGGSVGFDERPEQVTVVGYKRPELTAVLSRCLDERRIPHLTLDRFIDRDEFLGLLGRTRVAVCLPRPEEGFYLPALEAMAAGCTVVTLDGIGNRGFCRHGHNCFLAKADPASVAAAVKEAMRLPVSDRQRIHANAAETVRMHSLERERGQFHNLLLDIGRIWKDASAWLASSAPPEPEQAGGRLVDFVIAGAQKGGTSALAHFLSQHPAVAMAPREGHVFDSPDYSPDWTPEEIDVRYARRIERPPGAALCGESTPIYLFLPDVAAQLRRYNPALKVVVILRDPVERSLSHYAMERGRGNEHRPLWFALLAERWRLRRCPDPRGPESAARRHSYRSRSLYSGQLRNLFAAFPANQVLVLRSEDLRLRHDETLENVFAFLGVSVSVRIPSEAVFKGPETVGKHAVVRWLLRLSYAAESRRLRAIMAARCEP
ncbi:MAG: sulfotransferase domain-containing protein [Gammaproteobacteria bacterium]|nr:sulfotransferase domain-containing protein [Gammaproteobacteria bacterium]